MAKSILRITLTHKSNMRKLLITILISTIFVGTSSALTFVNNKDGNQVVNTKNGNKASQINYQDGKKVGETKYEYYDNGQKRTETNYKDGARNGKRTYWDINGNKISEEYYKKGWKDGNSFVWYRSGHLRSKRIFIADKISKYYLWYENGQTKW